MISENYFIFIVLNYKVLQTIIAMLTEDKDTEFLFMGDEFSKFFDWMMARYTLKNTGKRPYHRESTLSKAEIMLIIILFHDCFMIQGTVASSISILIMSVNIFAIFLQKWLQKDVRETSSLIPLIWPSHCLYLTR